MKNNPMCIISKSAFCVIDTIDEDGKTHYYGKTLDDVKIEHQDAEIMTLDDFCKWKAERQRTPITWRDTTEERFYYALEVLPPAKMVKGAFLLGEPADHDALAGLPRYDGYMKFGEKYCVSSRPMMVPEFNQILKELGYIR